MCTRTEFQTPSNVAAYMAGMIPLSAKTILEPTAGRGNLLTATTARFHGTICEIKIFFPDDFFLLEMKRFDCIIMNPPFSSKSANLTNAPANINLEGMRVGYYILDQCMEMSDNIIALMPWFTISDSDVRLRKLKEFGLISVTPLPRKTFAYARIQTVVIQLQHGYTGNTEFKFLPNH